MRAEPGQGLEFVLLTGLYTQVNSLIPILRRYFLTGFIVHDKTFINQCEAMLCSWYVTKRYSDEKHCLAKG